MRRIQSLLFIAIIIVLCDFAIAKRQFRSKRSGRDYVLQSCTATAHLIRKHRNHAIPNSIKNISTSETTFSLPKRNSKYHSPIKSDARTLTREESAKLKLPNKRLYHGRRIENHPNRDNLPELHLKDTPLKTVGIEAINNNRPLTFIKKDPLPELERSVPGKKINKEAMIIVVQNLHY